MTGHGPARGVPVPAWIAAGSGATGTWLLALWFLDAVPGTAAENQAAGMMLLIIPVLLLVAVAVGIAALVSARWVADRRVVRRTIVVASAGVLLGIASLVGGVVGIFLV